MSDITLTFPDGSQAAGQGHHRKELAESIAKSLAKRAVAMVVDGRLADLADPIEPTPRSRSSPAPIRRRWS